MTFFKSFLLILILSFCPLFAKEIKTPSVVKIFTTKSIPNYAYPWQTSKITKSIGSGAIISNNRILTSAHVVSNAKFIEIKKENDPNRYIAYVSYISHQSDLAILKVKKSDFFNNLNALKLNDNIKTRDEVTVLGYPMGGKNISTTTGIVSRIEYRRYAWSSSYLLTIQVDAAINSGNSGGPVVNNKNELIGIAMMKLNSSSNIAYIVPTYIINTFLEDSKDKKINGFAQIEIYTQNIDNYNLKEYYNLKNNTGVLITHVKNSEKTLKQNDILLEVDSFNIANDGTILSKYSRVSFLFAINKKQIGDSVNFKVLRDKKIINLKYILKRGNPLLKYEFESEPKYIIYGGLAFTPLTKNYSYKVNGLAKSFYQKDITKDYTQAVASINTIFPHKVNRSYYANAGVLVKVNGKKIKSFKHLVNILDNLKEKFTVFEFLEKRIIVLNTKEAKSSFKQIKNTYHLNSDRRE